MVFIIVFIISLILAVVIIKDVLCSTCFNFKEVRHRSTSYRSIKSYNFVPIGYRVHNARRFNKLGLIFLKPWRGLCGEYFGK